MLSYTKTDAAFYIPSATSPIVITKRAHPFAQSVYTNYPLPCHATAKSPVDGSLYSPFRNPQVGLSAAIMSSLVLTLSPGKRLTRCAPLRIACNCIAETPLRLLRMLPASLMVSWSRKTRLGGAKSREVKVPDLRRE